MNVFLAAALAVPVSLPSSDPVNRTGVGPELQTHGAESPAPPCSTRVSFETLPDGAPLAGGVEVTDQFASVGVTFGSECSSGATLVTNILDFAATPSGSNSLAPCGPSPNNGGLLTMDFDPPVRLVEVRIVDDQEPIVGTAFDAAGAPVAFASTAGVQGFEKLQFFAPSGIHRLELQGGFLGASPDGWAIDDLTFVRSGPTLEVSPLTQGAFGSVGLCGATPFGPVALGWSLSGPGPTVLDLSACGSLELALSAPVQVSALTFADSTGGVTFFEGIVPFLPGTDLWLQAVDLASCSISPGVLGEVD